MLKTYLSNGRGGSTLPRTRWCNQEQARNRARRRPRATRSLVRAHQCSWRRTYGTVERSRARKSGKERWMRIVFCLDPITLRLEGALEAALQQQKGVRKHGPTPRGPPEREASRLLTQVRGKWSVWRTEWKNTVHAWLSSWRRGVLEAFDGVCLPDDEERTAGCHSPNPRPKLGARSREMMSEGAEQTHDVSPPRLPPERSPIVFVRGETLEPSTARPKSANITEKPTGRLGTPAQE